MIQDKNILLKKKLMFRSCHRGIKEMDIILGGFASQNLPSMSAKDLSTFQTILEIPDQLLFSWYMRREKIPQEYQSDLLNIILNYKPIKTKN